MLLSAGGKLGLYEVVALLGKGGMGGLPRPRPEVESRCKRLAAMVADPEGEKLPTHLTFLLNFFDELRRTTAEGA